MARGPNLAFGVVAYVWFYQLALFRFVPNSNGLHSTELPQTCWHVARLEFGYWLFQCFSTLPSVVEIPNWYQINIKHPISSWPNSSKVNSANGFWFISLCFFWTGTKWAKGPRSTIATLMASGSWKHPNRPPWNEDNSSPLKKCAFLNRKVSPIPTIHWFQGGYCFWGGSLKVLPGLQVCWEKCPTSNSMPLLWKIAINFLRFECRT